jgi:uncharacterized protein (DUF1697 family)
MPVYISLLRGVNVGAHNQIEMSRLRPLLVGLGWEQVRTYIQSGNLVFQAAKRSPAHLSRTIEKALLRGFGFSVPVFTKSSEEMGQVIQNSPLAGLKGIDESKLHVSFLAEIPAAFALRKLAGFAAAEEQLRASGCELYLYCPHGYGRSRLANMQVERVLKVSATTRNWKTVNTLYEMSLE